MPAPVIQGKPAAPHRGIGRKILSQMAWIASLAASRDVWHATGGAWGVVAVFATISVGFILAGVLWITAT